MSSRPPRAQLLCLGVLSGDEELGERASHAWWALTRATHQHAYDLPPTATELRAWCADVEQVLLEIKLDEAKKGTTS